MTSTHFDVDDARSDRAAELREQRARARAERNGQEPEREPEPPKPVQAAEDPTRAEPVEVGEVPAPFEPVAEPPKRRSGRAPIPSARETLIAYCLKHPGQWVRYQPTREQDKSKPPLIVAAARKASAGFPEGFDGTVRAGVAYIQFTGKGE